jgi:molecular chaperone DnaK (HSP70)
VRYHPAAGEISPVICNCRGTRGRRREPVITGRLALDLGAQVPGRLVSSAKSWLSHASVDRLAPILPWGAEDEVAKVSPVAASASYLAHVRAAWQHRFPKAPLEQQQLILTVPASFDEGARALTLTAARQAGLAESAPARRAASRFLRLALPASAPTRRRTRRHALLLVCDVGGGTTDLTLIQVAIKDGSRH